nr:MAG TPA: hypothetical protein [Caudoviricetes sp.]
MRSEKVSRIALSLSAVRSMTIGTARRIKRRLTLMRITTG